MSSVKENLIRVPVKGKGDLEGDLQIPMGAKGIVVFAHGSGSSRHSPRNGFVAGLLQKGGLGTLLIDLLTKEEGAIDDVTSALRFDIDLLTDRLCLVTRWLASSKEGKNLLLGYFGASTGAAAALCAAAELKNGIAAVVSRGGRPDLARAVLKDVEAPTLLIVGGYDGPVIGMNDEAYTQLKCEKKMVLIPGATHLFEEPGKLEEVARLALDWFSAHFEGK
ncbi:MAG: alpha/beta hydrolase [Verrucomicrobia bacterium]|nr:alpha/beta hydrolase [Verrucomicrobiota bacterium]